VAVGTGEEVHRRDASRWLRRNWICASPKPSANFRVTTLMRQRRALTDREVLQRPAAPTGIAVRSTTSRAVTTRGPRRGARPHCLARGTQFGRGALHGPRATSRYR